MTSSVRLGADPSRRSGQEETTSSLEIRLMGSIEVCHDGRAIVLPGRRVRALLVLLALSAGRTVSIDTLANGIWDDTPPVRVRGSLQTYVGRLRRALGHDTITTEASGYTLQIPRHAVDVLAFLDRVEAAGRATDPEQERQALAAALSSWRDPPFGEILSEWMERHEAPQLVQRHLLALERRIDLDLAAGDHAACAIELHSQVERHPLRESLWVRLLLALHGCGRTAEALDQFATLRTRLTEELGVDPSPELQRLHRRLLSEPDPATGSTASRTVGPTPPQDTPSDIPRQLPADTHAFAGRADAITTLDALLARLGSSEGSRIVTIHGPAGVGKTTLAVHWAHRIKAHFPDGQLFVNLHGYGPGTPVSPLLALDALLRGVGVPGNRMPEDLEQRSALLRTELAGRRFLLVLDNARDAGQVRPLLPGGEGLVLVTSRSQLRSLAAREGARRVALQPMPVSDSVGLLTSRLGPLFTQWNQPLDPDELAELADLCGHLPVALAIAAERAGRDRGRLLRALNAQLRGQRDRLDGLRTGDDPLTDVRAVFEWSYRTLDDDAARMFRLIGLHPDTYLSVSAVAALAGTTVMHAERVLDRLTGCHLLGDARPGWYQIHDLVRMYAGELVRQVDSEDVRRGATQRLQRWYVHSAANGRSALGRLHPLIVIGDPEPDLVPEEFTEGRQVSEWWLDHRRNLTMLLAEAAASADHRFVFTLAPLADAFLQTTGCQDEAVQLLQLAESSARLAGDATAQAICASQLGGAHVDGRQFDRALAYLGRARDLFHEVNHRAGKLVAMMNTGVVMMTTGHTGEAVALLEETLGEARQTGMPDRVVAILNNLAYAYMQAERYDEAIAVAEEAVRGYRERGSAFGQATAVHTVGTAYLHRGSTVEAHHNLMRAFDLHRKLGDSSSAAATLRDLGLAQRELGKVDEARESWLSALRMFERLGTADNINITRHDLQTLVGSLGDLPQGAHPSNGHAI
ncbi:BTAD domain-containing putative transcriptional regulator [Plantactinospora mayteni]|uniref:SARP family transcriptional regulator n=1 Tax=Plantactinospora mayteni TaxID=566021 RepID=A0ABQ4EWC7_9ACTN|nr:BTAD domain-containing putative transcriptional regulator [Plantactinospora mayteni]GIG98931.1 SARP family transcriptional regulator [Plantactinospora mayteni]